MSIDPNRAAFLMEEWRRAEASNAGTLADYPTARRLEIDTNVSTVAGAQALADALIALLGSPRRVLEVQVAGVAAVPGDFDGAPPRYTLVSPAFGEAGGRTFTVASLAIDLDQMTTTFTLKG